MTRIKYTEGVKLWNKLIIPKTGIVPFVYNPVLFGFYEQHFKWKPYYTIFTSNNEPCCILPIIFTGKAWVSMPHFSHGGLLNINGDNDFNPSSVIPSLITMLKDEASGFFIVPVKSLENKKDVSKENYFIRTSFENTGTEFIKSEKVISHIRLANDIDEQWNSLSSNLRRKINKANNELVVKIDNEELLGDFHKVYTENISQLGSLTYGLGFFRDLVSCFKEDNNTLFVAYLNDKPIGSAMLVSYGNYFENLYFATTKKLRNTYVSDFLHWEMIKYSVNKIKESGKKFSSESIYSFGRSTIDSGVYSYKNHWPVENQQVIIWNY
ncbi:MAG: GNAT family N-acetyltransferase [Bacteroidetes bacterium]|nr:GNAT family N-acetyltransferase [Bacteroidota bacterium]